MDKYSRRSVLRGSLGLAAATTLGKPYIANAAAKTATVWVNQGFVKAEDDAFKQLAADYMKASGNTLEYSIMPFQAQNQKTVSALTSGDVPDLVFMRRRLIAALVGTLPRCPCCSAPMPRHSRRRNL